MSGRRDSNPLPTAWEAVALPGELLPLLSTVAFAKVEMLRSFTEGSEATPASASKHGWSVPAGEAPKMNLQ